MTKKDFTVSRKHSNGSAEKTIYIIFFIVGMSAMMTVGYFCGKQVGSRECSTTTSSNYPSTGTDTATGYPTASGYQDSQVAKATDPLAVYFNPTPCSTTEPDLHGELKTWTAASKYMRNKLKNRAIEIAGNNYYEQNKIYEKALKQYYAQQSIKTLSQNNEDSTATLKAYNMSKVTLAGILAASQEKCPENFVAQQDEIILQMNSYYESNPRGAL